MEESERGTEYYRSVFFSDVLLESNGFNNNYKWTDIIMPLCSSGMQAKCF